MTWTTCYTYLPLASSLTHAVNPTSMGVGHGSLIVVVSLMAVSMPITISGTISPPWSSPTTNSTSTPESPPLEAGLRRPNVRQRRFINHPPVAVCNCRFTYVTQDCVSATLNMHCLWRDFSPFPQDPGVGRSGWHLRRIVDGGFSSAPLDTILTSFLPIILIENEIYTANNASSHIFARSREP